MSASLILDGYTLNGTIPARGPWPAVTFRYRPALAEEVYEFLRQREQAPGKSQMKPVAELLQKHLAGWDVCDSNGAVAPYTAENIRRLPQPILAGLIEHILGYGEAEQEADVKN